MDSLKLLPWLGLLDPSLLPQLIGERRKDGVPQACIKCHYFGDSPDDDCHEWGFDGKCLYFKDQPVKQTCVCKHFGRRCRLFKLKKED
jgi:hypothetical protein